MAAADRTLATRARARDDWPASSIQTRSIDALIPYARNARTHSEEQVAQIAASIREFGWTIPVLIDEEGGLIAGHGRILAARKLGITEIPTMTARGWTEARKRAYILVDNQIPQLASWDLDLLQGELSDLAALGFDLSKIGFDADALAELFDPPGDGAEGLSDNYSRKIEAPVYEITGDKPALSDLIDETKTEQLRAEIQSAAIPDDVRAFLLAAAERHTRFNFAAIAEFYAHADAKVQRLMEQSALVIIDFDQAIESGFVKLSEGMLDQAEQSKARNYEE